MQFFDRKRYEARLAAMTPEQRAEHERMRTTAKAQITQAISTVKANPDGSYNGDDLLAAFARIPRR